MEKPRYISVDRSGDHVTVRNDVVGATLTFRDGAIVSRGGNHEALTKNNIDAMVFWAQNESRKDAA